MRKRFLKAANKIGVASKLYHHGFSIHLPLVRGFEVGDVWQVLPMVEGSFKNLARFFPFSFVPHRPSATLTTLAVCVPMTLKSKVIQPKLFTNEFAHLKKQYRNPRYPIVLCHGLLGIDAVKSPMSMIMPDWSYWGGIKEALIAREIPVYSGSVLPAGSIKTRAEMLREMIKKQNLTTVNLIGHSMGGLDARYLASKLASPDLVVKSITTISTPHHGSPIADLLIESIFTKRQLELLFNMLAVFGINDSTGFEQLTSKFMTEKFNNEVKDDPNVTYLSFGARFVPKWYSLFKFSRDYIQRHDGDNDGMVSVNSSQWGEYIGTLDKCDHLDVINMLRQKSPNSTFDPIAFYLSIVNNLAERGF